MEGRSVGPHRAAAERRARREAFVEAVLTAFPPLPFGLLAARAHARIRAQFAAAGQDVGEHDRLVAATAIAAGWRVGTASLRHFDRIAGLDVVTVTLTGRQRRAGGSALAAAEGSPGRSAVMTSDRN